MKYKKGTFITVPNRDVLYGMKGDTQSVYMWICRFTNDDGNCFPSIKKISECSGVSARRVNNCIKELVSAGLMTKKNRKDGDTYISNYYQLELVEVGGGYAGGAVPMQEVHKGSAGGAVGVMQEVHTKEKHIKEKQLTTSNEVAEVIKLFETVDRKNKTYYGNITQRSACTFLLDEYGLDEIKRRIEVLPQTNITPYFPKIYSPYDLKEKWNKLEDALTSKKIEVVSKRPIVI